jgi:hypothetical protein
MPGSLGGERGHGPRRPADGGGQGLGTIFKHRVLGDHTHGMRVVFQAWASSDLEMRLRPDVFA